MSLTEANLRDGVTLSYNIFRDDVLLTGIN